MTKIIHATIIPSDSDKGRYQATLRATFEGGRGVEEDNVLSWYDDELTFTESEFIGLTRAEVVELFYAKDLAYIQS